MASLRTLAPFLSLAILLFSFCESKDFLVGDSENAWKFSENPSNSLNVWASRNRFKVGDSLILKYESKVDSVLQVTKEKYEGCKTSNPIKEYKEDTTKVELDKSGPFYFISGVDGHCQKGQKLEVVVMSQKHDTRLRGSSFPTTQPPAAPPAPDNPSTSHAPTNKGGCFLALATLLGVAFSFSFSFVWEH